MFLDFAAHAQTAPAAAPAADGGAAAIILNLLPFVAIIAIFYFLLIRPQQKRQKDHKALVDNLKKGDTVVTYGGLIGKVTRVADDEIQIESGENVRLRVVRSMVMEVRNPAAATVPANDAKA
jgi:preprotein translocase subunit YajC